MAQHDYNIANQTGSSFRADLNNALSAIVSNNSGASEPATTFAFQWWADTTNGQLKLRNAANDAWIVIQELDGTLLMEDGTAGSPGLAFASDLDTGLFRAAANQLGIATNGTERVEFGTTEVVFNDGGADYNFRVEGDANTNLVVVDASADSIGIGTNAPGTLIEIDNAAPYVTFKNNTEEDTDGGRESRLIFEGEQSGGEISTLAQIEVSHDGTADDEAGKLIISTNDGSDGATPTAAVTIDSSQNVTVAGNLTASGISYPSAGPLSNRNIIINGAMQVWQRGTSQTTSGNYGADRFWMASASSAARSTDAPAGFTYSTKLTHSASDMSMGQPIELPATGEQGQLVAGTTVTLSYYAKVDSGTEGIATSINFRDGKFDSTNQVAFTSSNANATWTTTWTRYEHQFTVPTVAGTNILAGLEISGISKDAYITGVQLEVGSVATPFEHRSYGQELSLCQRYYWKTYLDNTVPGSISQPGAFMITVPFTGNSVRLTHPFKVQMRAAPTFTFYNPETGTAGYAAYEASGATNQVTMSQTFTSEYAGLMYATSAGFTGSLYWHAVGDAEL